MSEVFRISRSPPARTSMNYAALREQGMDSLRKFAGDTWTDHNVHDPGISFLESLAFAMTELGFRIQLDMSDLLRSGEANAPPNLMPAHRVLPSGPVTLEDLRKLLLDHPKVADARIATNVGAEVVFFEDLGNDPPFTYSGGYGFRVDVTAAEGPTSYRLEVDFRFPNEGEAAPFKAGAIINAADLVDLGGVWQPGSEPLNFEGDLRIEYSHLGTSNVLDVPVSLTLIDPPTDAATEAAILAAAETALESIDIGSLVQRFRERILTGVAAVRVVPRGLYQVALAFRQQELNSNTYSVDVVVTSLGQTYSMDIALPHWDEDEAAPFRQGASITGISMLDPGTGSWRALDERHTFFGILEVSHTGPAGTDTTELWTVLRIIDVLGELAPGDVTAVLDAAKTEIETVGTSGNSLAERFPERVRLAYNAVREVERYLAGWRNLCEAPLELSVSRIQEIAVSAHIEVTGSADLERLLAEIFLAIDRELSPPIRFYSLEEMRAKGLKAEEIYDGVLLRNGFLDDLEIQSTPPKTIYTSDILRLIMRLRGKEGTDLVAQENPTGRDIVAVTDLMLSNFINNRPISTDARDCLRLVETGRYRPRLSLAKSRIVFIRDDLEVGYDAARVKDLFDEMQLEERAQTLPLNPSPVWPVSRGEALPVADYYPAQNELPRIYGVGEASLPESASTERKAQALQTTAYLLLLEQFLANLTAQLAHINCFFSADPTEQTTYFADALYELTSMRALLKRFQPGDDWHAFVSDPENPHRQALRAAAEDRDSFLDRRNRMLDHLMSRHGQETVAWGQELHRWAQKELTSAGISIADLPAHMAERRGEVNDRLIQFKAAFLTALPELNAGKLQAFGTPLQHKPELARIQLLGDKYGWGLAIGDQDQLRSVDEGFETEAEASFAVEEAVILAAQPEFYEVVPDDGGFRYRLKDGAPGSGAALRVLGESPQKWSVASGAEDARQAAALRFRDLRLETSLTPMDRRIAHQTGIRSHVRRPLLTPIDAYFEIYDEVDSDGIIEKRWRLWEQPGHSGSVLLSSVYHFVAPPEILDPTEQENAAIALALESIHRVLRWGMDAWNYEVSPAGSDTFNFVLKDPNGDSLALRLSPMPSTETVDEAIAETVEHLNRLYSAEGFHSVEHLLLRPRQIGEPLLSLPLDEARREADPYSQRLSLVFPSGYARDFFPDPSDPETADILEVTPHRFRDLEFRRHAERLVRQACPAHLLPTIYWVDRQRPGTASSPASFDEFEARYFDWLESFLIPGSDPTVAANARANLVQAINAIANG